MSSARGSTFYYGMRLLPREKRDALFEVYAVARRIDDIADGDLPDDEKLRLLGEQRTRLPAGSAFHDLVDGAEMDVRGATYETFDAIERAGFDVLRSTPRASRTEKARCAFQTLRRGA